MLFDLTIFLFLVIRYNNSELLTERRNCISIDNDPLQCNYITQRMNVIQLFLAELQEVGSKIWDFSETLVAKIPKEPQTPLGGMFGKEHFGHLVGIEDPM